MKGNSDRSPLLHSKTLSIRKIKLLNMQFENVPMIWRKRFINDKWQMVLTDRMPNEFGGLLGKYFVDGEKRQIWLNVAMPNLYNNIVFIAFACYICMEYAHVNNSKKFQELLKEKSKEVKIFMTIRGNTSYEATTVFAEIFSLVLETSGCNNYQGIDSLYKYASRWVNGDVFIKRLYSYPSYMEVGEDVSEEQIEMVNEAFVMLPQKLKTIFIKEKWIIRLSRENLSKDSAAGLCSSYDKKIFIRSSSSDIQKTTWHEFGHYLDFKENFLSNTFSFKRIFSEEKSYLRNLYDSEEEFNYACSCVEEYFADVFSKYMTKPKELKLFTPKTYNMVCSTLTKWI